MNEYIRYLPDILLGVGGTLCLLIGAFREERAVSDFVRWLSLLIFVLAGVSVPLSSASNTVVPNTWIQWNSITAAFSLAFIVIGAWLVLAEPLPDDHAGEWYSLLQFAVLGMLVLARGGNLGALFLGLETLSLTLYILISFRYRARTSLRGGAMYLVLASFASAFLAFGLALVYAAAGTLDIAEIGEKYRDGLFLSPLAKAGFALFLVGAGFKLAVVPFHMWAADVYEAAPSAVSGLIASASKGAMIAALLPFAFLLNTHKEVLWLIAACSMIGGNLLGLLEQRVKRILAYSSIAHVGYILTAYFALASESASGDASQRLVSQILFFYIVAYSIAVLGAFAVLSQMENGREIQLRDLRGLLRRHPLSAWLLMTFVVSLAGIPPTVGFIGKLYLFLAAFKAGYVNLVLVGLIGSAVGVYYYLRILAQLFMSSSEGVDIRLRKDTLRDAVLTFTAVGVVVLGLLPGLLFSAL